MSHQRASRDAWGGNRNQLGHWHACLGDDDGLPARCRINKLREVRFRCMDVVGLHIATSQGLVNGVSLVQHMD